jgi:AraC family transcriptional regulator
VHEKNNESIEIKELPDIHVVYLRNVGPFEGTPELFTGLFGKLFTWAGANGLLNNGDFKTAIVYHDDIHVADERKLRTSICLTAPENTKVDGEIGKMVIEKGTYAVARFVMKTDEFKQAWDWLIGKWFPRSGYQPDDRACFELYSEEPKNGVFKVDICVPVRKL